MTANELLKYIWDSASNLIYGIYLVGSSQNELIDNPHDIDAVIILNAGCSKMDLINKIRLYEIADRPTNLDMHIHSWDRQVEQESQGSFCFLYRINIPKRLYGQEYNFITHKSQIELSAKITRIKTTAEALYNLFINRKIKSKRWYHLYIDYIFIVNKDNYELTESDKEKIIKFHSCESTDDEIVDLYNKIINLK